MRVCLRVVVAVGAVSALFSTIERRRCVDGVDRRHRCHSDERHLVIDRHLPAGFTYQFTATENLYIDNPSVTSTVSPTARQEGGLSMTAGALIEAGSL